VSNSVQQPIVDAPVVFLDTNAVHYATLALSFASVHGVDLATVDIAAFKATVKAQRLGAEEYYEKGAWIIRYLIRRSGENAEYYYSPVTGLELLCGGLRGEAVKRAANIGVPNRWFTRLSEDEICTHLEPDGYAHVQTQRTNVETLFQAVGITLNERQLNFEVWQLARTIMENIFIDVQDCVIYASALAAQANELITTDGFVYKTACYASNPGSARPALAGRFRTVRDALISVCSQVSGWPPDKVLIPKAVSTKQIKKYLDGTDP